MHSHCLVIKYRLGGAQVQTFGKTEEGVKEFTHLAKARNTRGYELQAPYQPRF